MNRSVLYVGIGVLVLLVAVVAISVLERPAALKGSVIEPPWPAPEMSLTTHDGQPFQMSAQRGKVVLLYFGYVNCPDECPLTMAHVKLARNELGDEASNVQVVMVSTDPVRDTPEALAEFMGKFDPSFLGLTGTPEALQKVWKDYGVAVEHGGETHSTFLFVIDPRGDIRETLLPETEPADIASDARLLLQGG